MPVSPILSIQELAGRLDCQEISRDAFVADCTQLMSHAIGSTRAGIWIFDHTDRGPALRCLGLYDRTRAGMIGAPDAHRVQIAPCFRALEQVGYIEAENIYTHPVTRQLFPGYDNVDDVRALLATSFMCNGCLLGAFTCAEVHRTVSWKPAQLVTLKRIANRAALALSGASGTGLPTLPMPL